MKPEPIFNFEKNQWKKVEEFRGHLIYIHKNGKLVALVSKESFMSWTEIQILNDIRAHRDLRDSFPNRLKWLESKDILEKVKEVMLRNKKPNVTQAALMLLMIMPNAEIGDLIIAMVVFLYVALIIIVLVVSLYNAINRHK